MEDRILQGKFLKYGFVLSILGTIAIIVFAIKWADSQKIESVSITGNVLLPGSGIMENLSDTLLHKANNSIKLKNIEKLLGQNPYIQKTYITHKNLNELTVSVKEYKPIASLLLENGTLQFIDSDIKFLPYLSNVNTPDVPLISGIFKNGRIDTVGIVGSLVLLSIINDSNFKYLNPLISEICYHSDNKNFELISSDVGTRIKIGTVENLEYKIKKLDSYWKSNLVSSSQKPKYIDLRWSNHIVSSNS